MKTWTCEACGATNESEGPFCPTCGEPRPGADGSRQRPARTTREEALPTSAKTRLEPAITDTSASDDPLDAIRGAQLLQGGDPPGADDPGSGVRPKPRAAATVAQSALDAADNDVGERIHQDATATDAHPTVETRRPMRWGRILPLTFLACVGAGLLTWGTIRVLQVEESSEAASSLPTPSEDLGEHVEVPSREAMLGLTDDNRESVLSACFRLSDNANHECRASHLGEIGELPLRRETLPAMKVHRFEVSNASWAACEAAGACPTRDWESCRYFSVMRYELGARVPESFRQSDHPAVCVTLEEAETYCAWENMRLPTGDEWEAIARGGDDRLQPWGAFWLPGVLNWGERDMTGFPIPGRLDGYEGTAPVTAFTDGESPDGVRNLFGNAAEWVSIPGNTEEGGIRGGSYADDVRAFRTTRETRLRAQERRSTVGFRCVAALP